jgi:hypothetical protein
MPPRIFISYRRDDAAGEAGRLSDLLGQRFGQARVFLDIETIQPGADFVVTLEDSLKETGVMLVVIGRRWVADGSRRRLDDPGDFVRLELETALARGTPIVPVLVQGATMPETADLPASLAAFAKRQAVRVDHDEFRDDANRLCDHVARILGVPAAVAAPPVPSWRTPQAAAAVLLAVVVAAGIGYWWTRDGAAEPDGVTNAAGTKADPRVETALAEAAAQHRRNQYVEALTTLAGARQLAPESAAVRAMQEDVAMDLIRNVQVENGSTSFGEAIKPALAVVDASLATASGPRKADLLAHSGWAAFLMWRDGDRRLDPATWYRDAMAIEPENPYANAMLAHWVLFQDDDVPQAARLFAVAEKDTRAIDAVRRLQFAGYGNARGIDADVERLRVADRMRLAGQPVNMRQAQALYNPYYFLLGRPAQQREPLLAALQPDDHLATMAWVFGEYNKNDASRRRLLSYYEALLHARAGRTEDAIERLTMLRDSLVDSPGSLQDAVTASLRALGPDSGQAPGPIPRRPLRGAQ